MKRILSIAALLVFAAAVPRLALAQGAKPADLVQRAVAAEGGADMLKGLQRLVIKADTMHWEPEQSIVADGPPRPLGTSTVDFTWDLDKGMKRGDWDHEMKYPFPGHERYIEIVTPQMGAVTDEKNGQRAMSPQRLAFDQREAERASPNLLLKALEMPANLAAAPNQRLGGKSYPAVAFTDGPNRFTILFDTKTHLPAAIRTFEDDDVHGDGHFDLVLGDWRNVGGAMVAHSLHYAFNDLPKLDINYKVAMANPGLAADAFVIDDKTRAAAKPAATGDIPWQPILVRMNFGRYDDLQVDKDAAEGLVMKLVEIAPNIQQATGRSHNSLVVAMPKYLVVFDAPQNEAQSRWTINAAKAKYPGRPVKYLVLTHHHMDHIGGMRTYIAEGATVIVGRPDKAHMEKVAHAKHSMHPDELARNHKAAQIIEVADRMSLKDGGSEVQILSIVNAHAEGMLIGYVLPEKLVWVTDLYSPGRDKVKTPNSAAFFDEIKKMGLQPAWYAGGHGTFGTEAELEAIMAAK